MNDHDLLAYEPMWTTERDQWMLFESSSGSYLPIQKGDPPMAQIICEDDDLAELGLG
jgi:hypothetical protein